jgi:hypothetical protein
MTANTAAKSGLVQQRAPTPSLEEEIRRRAYELYEQGGREPGHDVGDWLQAEEEVTQKRSRRAVA